MASHWQCISLTFMRPIKLAFISSPTAWIDSEVVCLWLDYTWCYTCSSSYAISFALCLTGGGGGIILTFHFITALYSLLCHLWLKNNKLNECIKSHPRDKEDRLHLSEESGVPPVRTEYELVLFLRLSENSSVIRCLSRESRCSSTGLSYGSF